MTDKHITSDLRNLINRQMEKRGFSIDIFKPRTKLNIETKSSYYQIEIIEDLNVKIMGGMLEDGNIRYPSPVNAIFNGSTWGTSLLAHKWIGEGMHLEMAIGNCRFTTSKVLDMEIETPEGEIIPLDWKNS